MTLVGWILIVYGCAGAIGCLTWLAVVWAQGEAPSPSLVTVEVLLVLHSAALIVTFHRRFGLEPLRPLIAVTEWSVRLARIALATLILVFVLGVAYLASTPLSPEANRTASLVFLDGLALVSMVYIVIHWALRPENVLWPSVVNFLASPIPYSVRVWRGRKLNSSRRTNRNRKTAARRAR
jgi:hypothetical protein